MTARVDFDGARQKAALSRFQDEATARGKTVTQVAAELGFSENHFRRYLWGKLPIRADQIEPFARALLIDPDRLVRAVFGLADDPADDESYDFLDELRAALPHDPARAEREFRDWDWAPVAVKRAMVDALKRMTASPPIVAPSTDYKFRPTGT